MEEMKDNVPFEDSNKKPDNNKKTVNAVIIAILTVALAVVAVVAAVFLVQRCGVDTSVATPDQATKDEKPTSSTVEPEDVTNPTMPNGEVYEFTKDWDEFLAINDEIKAWIDIPGTRVNYPVLKHEGDTVGSQYYLHRSYDHSYVFDGSIFIDYRSKQGVDSKNIITHGHKMNSGTMYGDLIKYGAYEGDLEYFKEHPTIFFNTPEGGVEQWMIVSVYKTNTIENHGEFFNYLVGKFSSDAQFMNYVYNIKVRSLFDINVPINENDRLLTLSTCSHEYTDFRTVIVARKIRPNESVIPYVKSAKLAENPVWPDIYYTDHYGSRPEVTTFKTEYKKGNIDWYDGSGNLKGSEWLISAAGKKSYTVSFLDYKGDIISTQTVPYGHDAVPPENPTKPDDDYYRYEFKEWQLDYHNVDSNMVIAPSFTPILKSGG